MDVSARQKHRVVENTCVDTKGEGGAGWIERLGLTPCTTTLCRERRTKESLLHGSGPPLSSLW